MALADNYRILEYVSDGKQVEFPVLWRFFDAKTVLVNIYDKDGLLKKKLSYGADYSVVATGEDTGRVSLTAPVESGMIIAISRLEPYVQLLELLNSGKFDMGKMEETLDHIVMLTQQNRDELLRCLQLPPGSDMTQEEFIQDIFNKYLEILEAWQKISIALQNLFSQTIVPFTTQNSVLEYSVGEDVILDPDANNLLLSVGGVVQEPDRAYTIVDKNHIRFTENPGAGLRAWGISCLSFANPDIRAIVQKAIEKIWAEANKIIASDAFVVPGTTESRNLLERFGDWVNIKDFGAKGDFDTASKTGTDNQEAIQKAIYFAAKNKKKVWIPAGLYGVWNNYATRMISKTGKYSGTPSGGLDLPANSYIEFEPGAWLIQMHPTATGGFLANSNSGIFTGISDQPDYASSNIKIVRAQIDGSFMELWNTPNSKLEGEGCNENGIAFTAHGRLDDETRQPAKDIILVEPHVKGYLAMRRGPGGKGICTEDGVQNLQVISPKVEDCTFATSIVYGYGRSTPEYARNIVFSDVQAIRCGIAFYVYGRDTSGGTVEEINHDPATASIVWTGSAWCCGHHPDFFDHDKSPKGKRKCAAIVLAGAANIYIDAVVNNPSTYPSAAFPAGGTRFPASYPASDPSDVNWRWYGSSLSGNPSLFAGWGRNVTMRIVGRGAFDNLWQTAQPFNVGYDATHTSPFDCKGFNAAIDADECNLLINNGIETSSLSKTFVGNWVFNCPKIATEEIISPSATPFASGNIEVSYEKNGEKRVFHSRPSRRVDTASPWKYEDVARDLFFSLACDSLYAGKAYLHYISPDPVDKNTALNVNLEISSQRVKPLADNTHNLGSSSLRWGNIYAASGEINTSDAREKQDVQPCPDAVLDAWGNVEFRQFLFNDSVVKKGLGSARFHAGVIAQQVVKAFSDAGLDATRYGLLCFDQWTDVYEDVEVVDVPAVLDEDGREISPAQTHMEKKLVIAAGERYGIRYTEALCMEAAYQRRRADRLEERITAIENEIFLKSKSSTQYEDLQKIANEKSNLNEE